MGTTVRLNWHMNTVLLQHYAAVCNNFHCACSYVQVKYIGMMCSFCIFNLYCILYYTIELTCTPTHKQIDEYTDEYKNSGCALRRKPLLNPAVCCVVAALYGDNLVCQMRS